MGIKLKCLNKDSEKLKFGYAIELINNVANAFNQNIEIRYVPKQWRVHIVAFGQKFTGTDKDNNKAFIAATKKFAEYMKVYYDHLETKQNDI